MKRSVTVVAIGLVLVAVAAGIWLLRGAEPGADVPAAQSRALTGDPTVGELTSTYLGADPPQAGPVATGQGVIYASDRTTYQRFESPGTLKILAVDVSESSTHVRISLSAEKELTLDNSEYVESTLPGFHTAVLVSEQADVSMTGARWTGTNDLWGDCTCGSRPKVIDADGVEVSLLFPALADSATEIQLKIPGFVPLTAPVTRVGTP